MRNTRWRSAVVLTAGSLALTATACGSGSGTGDGGEVTLTFAHPLPETHYNARLDKAWMDAVTEDSGGEIEFEVTYAGGLCAAPDINGCVSDGIADLGHTNSAYHPAASPVSTISSVGFVSKDASAQAEALHTLYQEYPEYEQEFAGQNQQLLYFEPIEVPTIISTREGLTSVDDLAGMKLRANGPYVQAVEYVGASPVTIDVNEIYESLERNVIDGAQLSASAMISDYQLNEVATNVYDIGQYVGANPSSHVVMNTDTWGSLSEEHQEVIQRVSNDYVTRWGPEFLVPTYEETCEEFADEGMTTTVLEAPSDAAEWEETVQGDQRTSWADQSGLSNPEEFFDRYVQLLDEFATPETDKSALEYCL